MIVIARALQGFGGGCLMPMAQAVCMESFKGEARNKAMAIFGLVVIIAPIIGPVMGVILQKTGLGHTFSL